jgi:undecaprenyl diphosphate synthase
METKLDPNRIPRHIAIVMDGNGRWAKERGLIRVQGHSAGVKSLTEVLRAAGDLGVKVLTVYAFSTENWKRPSDEVGGIFKLLVKSAEAQLKGLVANNVRVRAIGEIDKLPPDARESLQKVVEATETNDGIEFLLALNYGARREILLACRDLAEQAKAGAIDPEAITEEDISKRLFTAAAAYPDPDLIIRTGGEKRLSNFLLWQGAYAELVFRDTYWPDFTPAELEDCILEYQSRDRRFGGLTQKKG